MACTWWYRHGSATARRRAWPASCRCAGSRHHPLEGYCPKPGVGIPVAASRFPEVTPIGALGGAAVAISVIGDDVIALLRFLQGFGIDTLGQDVGVADILQALD